MNKLSNKIKHVYLLRNILISFIFIGLIIYGIILITLNEYIAGILLILLPIPFIILLLIWPTLSYNRYFYKIDELRIIIKHGVIFKHTITIPVRQIQDIHLYAGPIMMLFKLNGIIISTGGSNHNISGLDEGIAKRIVKELEDNLNKRLDRGE